MSTPTAECDFFYPSALKLLIKSGSSFHARLQEATSDWHLQSKFVRHSWVALMLSCLIGLEWETYDYWRRANRVTCNGGFSLQTMQGGLNTGSSFTAYKYRRKADGQINILRHKWWIHHTFISEGLSRPCVFLLQRCRFISASAGLAGSVVFVSNEFPDFQDLWKLSESPFKEKLFICHQTKGIIKYVVVILLLHIS